MAHTYRHQPAQYHPESEREDSRNCWRLANALPPARQSEPPKTGAPRSGLPTVALPLGSFRATERGTAMTKPFVVVAFPVWNWPEMRDVIAPQAILQKDTLEEAQDSAEEATFLMSLEDEMTHTYVGMSREDFNKIP